MNLIEAKGFLKKNIINNSVNLQLPILFSINRVDIEKIEQAYIPNEEVGGFLICTVNINEKKLEVIDIEPVVNISEDKSENYIPDEEKKLEVINRTFTNQLIPLFFHTHSTYGNISEFFEKTETSIDGDQCIYSQYHLYDYNIYFPDVLIVCHQDYNLIFIGLYGGKTNPPLPLDFATQKISNIRKSLEETIEIIRYIEKIDIWIKISVFIAIVYILFKYPKAVISMILATVRILPFYSFEHMPKQFKLDYTNTNKIEIILPSSEKLDNNNDDKIRNNNNIGDKIDEDKINIIGIKIDRTTLMILLIIIFVVIVMYFGRKR